jgi:hypothetical protein
MCEQHLIDFDNQLQRFNSILETAFVESVREVELGLRFLYGRLHQGPHPYLPLRSLFVAAAQISSELNNVYRNKSIEDYDSGYVLVGKIGKDLIQAVACENLRGHSGIPVDHRRVLCTSLMEIDISTAWRLRLAMQTNLLDEAQSCEPIKIFTVADDRSHRYALPYFLIDLWLLQRFQLQVPNDR